MPEQVELKCAACGAKIEVASGLVFPCVCTRNVLEDACSGWSNHSLAETLADYEPKASAFGVHNDRMKGE